MHIVLIVVVILLVAAGLYIRTPAGKGALGEIIVRALIGRDKEGKRRSFHGFMFRDDFHTVEIDHIVINPYGVFVIETKSYSGKIYGHGNSETWTQYLGRSEFKIYNPIKQNRNHIVYLRKRLKTNLFIDSVIVLTANSEKKITSPSIPVIEPLQLRKHLKKDVPRLNADQIEELHHIFKTVRKEDAVTKREHVKNVKRHLRTKQR